jgi:hypothetical protein
VCDGTRTQLHLLPATESLPKDRDKNTHPCDCVFVCVCNDDDDDDQVTDISLLPVEVLFRTLRIKRFFFFFPVFCGFVSLLLKFIVSKLSGIPPEKLLIDHIGLMIEREEVVGLQAFWL